MTKQRRMILEELRRRMDHPTAEEIYFSVKQHLPKISLATVYRNLETLTKAGLIRKLDAGPQNRYDADLVSHPHFRCVGCGRIEDLPDGAVVPPLPEEPKWNDGREVFGWNSEIIGLCGSCSSAQKNDGGPSNN